jgi:hypothetical protein
MAFKRSGVRLPLAPPIHQAISIGYFAGAAVQKFRIKLIKTYKDLQKSGVVEKEDWTRVPNGTSHCRESLTRSAFTHGQSAISITRTRCVTTARSTR